MTDVGKFRRLLAVFEYDAEDLLSLIHIWQKKDIEQATEFLQKWQRVITARLTESDKALAAESRILREKEFIQLKKDRVIIHTGHLAGRLLADVLMADLMENTDSIQSPALAAAA